MIRTALFLSPHLDDAIFSSGGLAALLHDRGWCTVLVTAFTATVLPSSGFALACQLDKGLSAKIDYMALRRAEDLTAAAILGFSDVRHLGLAEAPHRGYENAASLFGAVRTDDDIAKPLAEHLAMLEVNLAPDLVVAPQGLGNHVDHIQMVRAVRQSIHAPLGWFRDTPYAIRSEGAVVEHTHALSELRLRIDSGLERKLRAVCAYGSQIGFQFGGPECAQQALRDFAKAEMDGDGFGERLAASDAALRFLTDLNAGNQIK